MAVQNLILLTSLDFIIKLLNLSRDVFRISDIKLNTNIDIIETTTLYITNITPIELTKNGIWIRCNGTINSVNSIKDPFFIPYNRIIKINNKTFLY